MTKVHIKNCLVCNKIFKKGKTQGSGRWKKRKYCSSSCAAKINRNAYKRGGYKSNGYVFISAKGHPHADRDGYMEEHRIILEKQLGRYLLPHPQEIAHHKNGISHDNRLENLELLSQSEHVASHNLGNKNWLGKKHTKETILKMSNSRKMYFKRKGLYGY